MTVHDYAIGGVPVRLAARAAQSLEPLRALLEGFPERAARPRWRVLLLERPALAFEPRLGAPRDGVLPEGTPLRGVWAAGGRQQLVDGRLGIRIDYRRRLAICRLGGAANLLAGTAGIGLIDAILEQEQQHLIHAALLELPAQRGGGGLLLLGDSGAGKSSTALALARGGFALAGDDAAVLCAGAAGGVEAWGFPRAPKVHPLTARLLPWLQPLVPASGEEEVEVERRDLAGLVPLTEVERRLTVRAIAFLGPRGEAHRAAALGASEAALRLTASQLYAPDRRMSRAVAEQFRLMAGLAQQARWRLELSLGPDLPGLPAWLERQLT